MTSLLHAALLSLCFAAAPASAAQATSFSIELEALDGSLDSVPLTEFVLADRLDDAGRLAALRISFPGRPVGSDADAAIDQNRLVVELLGGDRIAGLAGGGRGEQLLVEGPGGTPIPVAIDAIDRVLFPARLPEDPGIRVERPEEGDRLYRRVGRELDRVDGTLDGFEAAGVRFESLVGSSVVPWNELAALFVEPLGGSESIKASAAGPPVVVDLIDGSRLSGALLRLNESGLGLELTGETRVLFEVGEVALISARDSRLAYVSDLEPVRVVEGSAFGDEVGMVFRHRIDRAIFGEPLLCGGRRHARGIGVLAPSRIEWNLPAENPFTELRGSAGLDAATAKLGLEGSVRFAIELDGKQVWTSDILTVAQGPVRIPSLDVSGAERLALVAHMERDWNTGDLGDWLGVRLIRGSGS